MEHCKGRSGNQAGSPSNARELLRSQPTFQTTPARGQQCQRLGDDAGAVVLELLPFNWNWKDFSRIYLNATRSLGDIHHFAWLARSAEFIRYRSENESRYAHWTAAECSSRYLMQ